MAAGEPKFSHITVTPDDEDDVVIQAGARRAQPAPAPAEEPEAPESAPEPEAAPAAAPDPDPAPKAERKDDRRETTADDLESAPMPLVQKVLVIAALALVVVMVAYIVTH